MSKTEITFSENKTKDTALSVPCIKCNGATKHKVIGSLDKDGCEYDQAEGWSVEWEDHYQIIQCQGCESVSFRHTSWFSEDADPMNGDSGQTERLYPKRNTNEITAKSFYNVPSNLRRIYGELVDCFNNESPTLCAAGLQEKGLLTQSSAQTLHEHRYLGNDAVHELARPSEDELRLAIEIIEHTLQQLYELPEKAEELRRATARRKK
jgi:hypothetical protein